MGCRGSGIGYRVKCKSPFSSEPRYPKPETRYPRTTVTNNDPFKIETSARIARLPPYLFGRINKMKYEKRVNGIDIIDLGMGNPTDPTPEPVVKKLAEAARDQRNQRYSVSNGIAGLRKEVAKKYSNKNGVELDPESEIIATIGSKEGFSHLCLALLGPGDTAIVPHPAFPIHIYAVAMAGANVIRVPLGNDQAFLDRIERTIEGLYPTPKLDRKSTRLN